MNCQRMPIDIDIEFRIEVVLVTHPISKAPYGMTHAKLKELKDAATRIIKQGFYLPVFVAVVSARIICKEEGLYV